MNILIDFCSDDLCRCMLFNTLSHSLSLSSLSRVPIVQSTKKYCFLFSNFYAPVQNVPCFVGFIHSFLLETQNTIKQSKKKREKLTINIVLFLCDSWRLYYIIGNTIRENGERDSVDNHCLGCGLLFSISSYSLSNSWKPSQHGASLRPTLRQQLSISFICRTHLSGLKLFSRVHFSKAHENLTHGSRFGGAMLFFRIFEKKKSIKRRANKSNDKNNQSKANKNKPQIEINAIPIEWLCNVDKFSNQLRHCSHDGAPSVSIWILNPNQSVGVMKWLLTCYCLIYYFTNKSVTTRVFARHSVSSFLYYFAN